MRLLIVSGSPLVDSGGFYYAYDTWLRLVQHLNAEIGSVTLWSPVQKLKGDLEPPGSWRIDRDSLTVVSHEYFNTFAAYYRRWPFLQRRLRREFAGLLASHDVVLLRTPSPMTMLLTREARRQGKPIVMMVLGNLATQAVGLVTNRGLVRLAYKAAVQLAVAQEVWAGRQATQLFVYSQEIARRHRAAGSNPQPMQDPSLRLEDFEYREDTCQANEIRIIRAAWLIASKGLEPLIEAIALLRQEGRNVVLDLIGHERTAGYEASLRALVTRQGLDGIVRFRGWVPTDRLGEEYLRSDIQVISSLSEGTPRCIVEGFARGVPLVCTNVGGCGDILTHEEDALLVPPSDPRAIASAVARLIDDGALRRRLIAAGYPIAKGATFEYLGASFTNSLREAMDSRGPGKPAPAVTAH
jgi:glycosyltransferase involved in cell wall biosynthesis